MDFVTIIGSLIGIVGGIAIVCVLRKQKAEIALGVGGPIILLGLILLIIAYDLISGIVVWVMTGTALIILGSFSYIALRRAG